MQPVAMILIGFVFSLLGFALPLLIVIHVIPSTFFLNFFAAASMMLGLVLGILGAGLYVRRHRR